MWAKVESGSVTEVYTRPKQLTIGNTQYPRNIFQLWNSSELEAIGIYEVEVNNTNLKDQGYYNNTSQTFTFGSGKVTASYGSATAKSLTDTSETVDGVTTTILGLKSVHKSNVNSTASTLLQKHDWMSIREAEGGTDIPSNIKTWRAAVRTKANSMCTQIDNATNVDALAALYVYNSDDPPVRPLGEFPSEPS
tara:strand:+ start:3794 stop:4372 length:579 start_codon:yes stop_codon:yes gene_type:complete